MSNVGITRGNYNTFIKSVNFNIEICKNSIAKKTNKKFNKDRIRNRFV